MGRSGIIVTGLVAIALVIGGIVVVGKKSKNDQTVTSSQTTNQPESPSSTPAGSSSGTQASVATITYTSSGFSPNGVTIKSGDKITIKNDSSAEIQVYSNPHPTHGANTELNVGSIAQGASTTLTVSKIGAWGYHNHFNPTQTGTITVQ